MRRNRRLFLLLLTAAAWGCRPAPEAPPPTAVFADVTEEVGLDFVHFNGMTGNYYYNEMVGSGLALFDLENDGDLDLYLVQGTYLATAPEKETALFPPEDPDQPPRDRLYRNELVRADGTLGTLQFTDVTETSGLRSLGYGMGVATGDYDNDGFTDLYVTNHGPNQLWRNRGDGTFEDVTERTGTDDPRWSTSASFVDVDGDDWLDLFVANYVNYEVATGKRCTGRGGAPDYCGPQSYAPETDRLFLNDGRGSFVDAASTTRIGIETGSGLGVVTADFDLDGSQDIYVANDLMRNALWQRAGEDFENTALLAGCAVDHQGGAQASMGVAAADLDEDGDEDLFMTHLDGETNTLYWNEGGGLFRDGTVQTGLGSPSLGSTGFGVAVLDFDLDGHQDIAVGNGAVRLQEAQKASGEALPLRQPNQLYRNRGGAFQLVDEPVFQRSEVTRGMVAGDLDNDGDPDLVLTNNGGPARIFLNQTFPTATTPWLGLRVVSGDPPRDALGAWVVTVDGEGRSRSRRVGTDGSYCSASDPRILIGVGTRDPVSVTVSWPDGRTESWPGLATESYHTLVRGAGTAAPAPPQVDEG